MSICSVFGATFWPTAKENCSIFFQKFCVSPSIEIQMQLICILVLSVPRVDWKEKAFGDLSVESLRSLKSTQVFKMCLYFACYRLFPAYNLHVGAIPINCLSCAWPNWCWQNLCWCHHWQLILSQKLMVLWTLKKMHLNQSESNEFNCSMTTFPSFGRLLRLF